MALVFVFALVAVLPFGDWEGWDWWAALLFKSRFIPALIAQAVLFGLWHIAHLFLGAPIWAVFTVIFVPFLSGIGWGWQVQRDRTVLWAMVQHSLIWVVGY